MSGVWCRMNRGLLPIAIFLLAGLLTPFTAAETPAAEATAVPAMPEIVALDGADATSLETADAASNYLVWGMRPANAPSTHWTTLVLEGELAFSSSNHNHFIFAIWDGVSLALCDNHPGYVFTGYPDGYAEFWMLDGAQLIGGPGVAEGDATCGVGPTMDGTNTSWPTLRITGHDTQIAGEPGVPVQWHGDLSVATL